MSKELELETIDKDLEIERKVREKNKELDALFLQTDMKNHQGLRDLARRTIEDEAAEA